MVADGVHDLAEQILVAQAFRRVAIARPLDDLPPEAVDLVGRHRAEVVVQSLAALELLAVDEQRAELAVHRLEPGDPQAGRLVVPLGFPPIVAAKVARPPFDSSTRSRRLKAW